MTLTEAKKVVALVMSHRDGMTQDERTQLFAEIAGTIQEFDWEESEEHGEVSLVPVERD